MALDGPEQRRGEDPADAPADAPADRSRRVVAPGGRPIGGGERLKPVLG